MEQQTPRPVAYLARVMTGGRSGIWVIFDADRILYGAAGESRRALQIRWRRAGSACPVIQRRPEVLSQAEIEHFIAQTRQRLAGGVVQQVPQYFHDCCTAAQQRTVRSGYQHPGRVLAQRLADEQPGNVSADAWHAEVDHLRQLVERGDNDAVLAWFDAHFTACMMLIPQRRRKAFVRGASTAIREII
jgi:hypothetical protein